MEEHAFKTELAKYKTVRAPDYIRTQYKESSAAVRPTPLLQGDARAAVPQPVPIDSDTTFWGLMTEIVGAEMDAAQRDRFFTALKQEISSVPEKVNLDFMNSIAGDVASATGRSTMYTSESS